MCFQFLGMSTSAAGVTRLVSLVMLVNACGRDEWLRTGAGRCNRQASMKSRISATVDNWAKQLGFKIGETP